MTSQSAARLNKMSWFEASARQRVAGLVDPDSFVEFIGPEQRETSPHLQVFDLPVQFDDGIVVGTGRIDSKPVLIAAQEGRFMGGAFGEVHGAKLTGLLHAAKSLKRDVVIAFDTGGVRLQEANAGEVSISEIIRALVEARTAGIHVVGLFGGRAGCYGGGGLIAGCCSALIASEHGRIGVSGPEVIETNKGVEEFDSRDRALVWRTMGGKHRYMIGGADVFVDDNTAAFREAAIAALKKPSGFDGTRLAAEQSRLERRLTRFGSDSDSYDVWRSLGLTETHSITELSTEAFLRLVDANRETADDAR
jgi:malonate decarboxylase beta subunit